MELLKSLERSVADVHKGLPHLPEGFRKWLVDNIWWLVVIGVVLSVLSIFSLLQLISLISSHNTVGGVYSGYVAQSITWVWVTLIVTVVEVALLAMAISPLKAKQSRGWYLLFAVSIISIIVSMLGVFFGGGVASLIGALIGIAISWYLLFEIRSGFVKA